MKYVGGSLMKGKMGGSTFGQSGEVSR